MKMFCNFLREQAANINDFEKIIATVKMDLNGLKKHLNLMNISQKAIMRKVIKDVSLKLMFNYQKIYKTYNDYNDLPFFL